MANSKQAEKRARQAVNRRARNMSQRSRMRTCIKGVKKAVVDGDKDEANKRFREAMPAIDAMVTKGIIHKNTAARYKSRLNASIRGL